MVRRQIRMGIRGSLPQLKHISADKKRVVNSSFPPKDHHLFLSAMLARRLTIWFLVFVMSGFLWLAMLSNGYSAETCTTLNCVNRGKRKVEKQMRPQEMMMSGGRKSKR